MTKNTLFVLSVGLMMMVVGPGMARPTNSNQQSQSNNHRRWIATSKWEWQPSFSNAPSSRGA